MKILKLILASVLLVCVVLFAAKCGSGGSKKIKRGDVVTITAECIATNSEDALDDIVKYSNQHDGTMVEAIAKEDGAVILHKGMGATLERRKVGKVQIRLVSGRVVWVLSNCIQ